MKPLRSHHFKGAKYLERGFIGRRLVLRDIYKAIEARQGAVVLKGPGGIGKSTITTRAAANLAGRGYEFIVARGKTSPAQILEALSSHLAGKGEIRPEASFTYPTGEMEKLAWFLDNYLLKHKVVIIFDDFEENQDVEEGDFKAPGLREFLRIFREALFHHDTFLLFSTRYGLPGYAEPGFTIEIPELTSTEFSKILGKCKALRQLDVNSARNLWQEIGGNPRALELLDQVAGSEFAGRDFTWEQLKGLIPELRQRIIERKSTEDDFTPLFLAKLLGYLTESQQRLLDIFSIFRIPVPEDALEAFEVKMERGDRNRLVDFSLLEYSDDEKHRLYYVHRLTAGYVIELMAAEAQEKYHRGAAKYLAGIRNEKGEANIEYLIEARWHYMMAGEWDRAVEITFDLEYYFTLHGYPQYSLEMLREFDGKELAEKNRAILYHQTGNLYLGFGDYDAALKLYEKAMGILEKIGDNTNVATSLHQIGRIYLERGNYEAALKHYQQSLEIRKNIGDTNGIAESLHQTGIIYHMKGDYEAALNNYQKALEMSEKIGDIKGVATSLHQTGIIYQLKGDYEVALKQYEKAGEILEMIGDIKGMATSLHQTGMIYQLKGDNEAALKQYEKSLEIAEKIGDIPGVAISMGQMGNLHLQKNDIETALKYCIQAFLIFSKIGSPYAKQAQADIARCREKLPEKRFIEISEEFGIKMEIPDPGEKTTA